ncbi:MAG: hypothetical protein QM526_00460 [Alphaproteobacteria bacterium]|nr:hypothetical protein [Alphaproteobacteria bacterium]
MIEQLFIALKLWLASILIDTPKQVPTETIVETKITPQVVPQKQKEIQPTIKKQAQTKTNETIEDFSNYSYYWKNQYGHEQYTKQDGYIYTRIRGIEKKQAKRIGNEMIVISKEGDVRAVSIENYNAVNLEIHNRGQ